MGEVFKPDDLVRRVAQLEQQLQTLAAALWRKERIGLDLTAAFVSSTSYNDSGVPFSLDNVQPGPAGYLIIGLFADVSTSLFGGTVAGLRCSVSLSGGPTAMNSDDARSIALEGDSVEASIGGYFPSTHLDPGVYSLNWESKSLTVGGSPASIISSRAIVAISV